MANVDPERNRLYSSAEDLHPLHWEQLALRDPGETARASGATWDGTAYSLAALGRVLRAEPGRRSIAFADEPERPVGFQRALVAVTYLAGALEAPVKGEWVSFRELPGGDGFFRGPHSLAMPKLVEAFGEDSSRLWAAAEALGGRRVDGADAAAEISALPRIPLRVLVWGRTAEFPASATLLTDARAHLHLPLDVLWALSNVVIADLTRAAD